MISLTFLTIAASSGSVFPISLPPNLGKPLEVSTQIVIDRTVMADGEGLPDGFANAAQGEKIYLRHCLSCHGPEGAGDSADQLARAGQKLTDAWPEKTVGNFWPCAPTLFDFIRRTMPMDKPGSLSDTESYALTAYLLYLNELVSFSQKVDKKTLSGINMPNRNNLILPEGEELKGLCTLPLPTKYP